MWAIAKHYNRDHSILPPPPETMAMSSEDMLGVAEAWILQAESDDTAEKRVKETGHNRVIHVRTISEPRSLRA